MTRSSTSGPGRRPRKGSEKRRQVQPAFESRWLPELPRRLGRFYAEWCRTKELPSSSAERVEAALRDPLVGRVLLQGIQDLIRDIRARRGLLKSGAGPENADEFTRQLKKLNAAVREHVGFINYWVEVHENPPKKP